MDFPETQSTTNPTIRSVPIQTGLGPMTDRIISDLLDKFTVDKYRDKINDGIVDPITQLISQRLRPYVYLSGILYAINIGLLCLIIYLLLRKKSS